MNKKLGFYSSVITFAAVLGFAVSMLTGVDGASYISSLFISLGFLPMICSYAALSEADSRSAGYTAIAFAAVYAVFICAVYFTQLTTVRLEALNTQAAAILDYQKFGLFFNLDLLGYAFMALSTFFISFTIRVDNKRDKLLKTLMMIHGIFAVSCFIMPMLGLFKPDMAGGDMIGTIVLEFWCVYFMPVCALSFLHFRKIQKGIKAE